VHTQKGFIRSVSQAQNCEKSRGRSHAAPADHQVGSDARSTKLASPNTSPKSRYFVSLRIDPQTGEPVEVPPSD